MIKNKHPLFITHIKTHHAPTATNELFGGKSRLSIANAINNFHTML